MFYQMLYTPYAHLFVHQLTRLLTNDCSTIRGDLRAEPLYHRGSHHLLVKKHVRNSKYDDLVDEAELIEANPQYAHIRLTSGRETTVSLRDLAPLSPTVDAGGDSSVLDTIEENSDVEDVRTLAAPAPVLAEHTEDISIRTSTRVPRATKRLIEEM